MSEELKPCPFCGCSAELSFFGMNTGDWQVTCCSEDDWCRGYASLVQGYQTSEAAIKGWNTRPDDHKGEVK